MNLIQIFPQLPKFGWYSAHYKSLYVLDVTAKLWFDPLKCRVVSGILWQVVISGRMIWISFNFTFYWLKESFQCFYFFPAFTMYFRQYFFVFGPFFQAHLCVVQLHFVFMSSNNQLLCILSILTFKSELFHHHNQLLFILWELNGWVVLVMKVYFVIKFIALFNAFYRTLLKGLNRFI